MSTQQPASWEFHFREANVWTLFVASIEFPVKDSIVESSTIVGCRDEISGHILLQREADHFSVHLQQCRNTKRVDSYLHGIMPAAIKLNSLVVDEDITEVSTVVIIISS